MELAIINGTYRDSTTKSAAAGTKSYNFITFWNSLKIVF